MSEWQRDLTKSLIPFAIVTCWLGATAAGFWQLEMRYFRPVTGPAPHSKISGSHDVLKNSNSVALPLMISQFADENPGKIILVNFWAPGCACSRFNEAHFRDLQLEQSHNVAFLTLVEPTNGSLTENADMNSWRDRNLSGAVLWDKNNDAARTLKVWAAPAAVVLDSEKTIRYIGAYNAGRFCSQHQTAWVDIAINAIEQNKEVTLKRTVFFGCQTVHS